MKSCGDNSCEAGFSLLELAIVLLILGIIGGLSIPLMNAHMTRTALVKTRMNQDYVVSALTVYVGKNKRFPCPASPQLMGADFGLALETCRMEKAKGIIPFKTLGISEIYARDGFKRLMTYVVEPELTKKQINPQEESGGFITLKNEDGFSVLPPHKTKKKDQNYISFILISHGASGVGAYKGNGKSSKISDCSMSPHKEENCNENFIFVDSTQSDDILRWETRDQFLQHYVRTLK